MVQHHTDALQQVQTQQQATSGGEDDFRQHCKTESRKDKNSSYINIYHICIMENSQPEMCWVTAASRTELSLVMLRLEKLRLRYGYAEIFNEIHSSGEHVEWGK